MATNIENSANKVVSTVKMNCGCSLSYSGSPAYVVESAIRHVQETNHTVDILGSIKSTKPKPVYVSTPYYKTQRREFESQ